MNNYDTSIGFHGIFVPPAGVSAFAGRQALVLMNVMASSRIKFMTSD